MIRKVRIIVFGGNIMEKHSIFSRGRVIKKKKTNRLNNSKQLFPNKNTLILLPPIHLRSPIWLFTDFKESQKRDPKARKESGIMGF